MRCRLPCWLVRYGSLSAQIGNQTVGVVELADRFPPLFGDLRDVARRQTYRVDRLTHQHMYWSWLDVPGIHLQYLVRPNQSNGHHVHLCFDGRIKCATHKGMQLAV